jgi:serine/threonine protein kinase
MHRDKKIRFSEEQVLKLLIQSLKGLKAAYDKGINHCDVKPGNLFIDSNGLVKLGDLGVAEMAHLTAWIYGPQKGQNDIGTLLYMAYDIWSKEDFTDNMDEDDRKKLLAKCDTYSLGVSIYEVMMLERAFK